MSEEIKPMEYQNFMAILKHLPTRFLSVIWQIIGSKKSYMVALTVWMFQTGVIPPEAAGYTWIIIFVIYLFGLEGLKLVDKLKK